MTDALPLLVQVTQSYAGRLPRQRDLDTLARLEPTIPFAELAQTQPFRIVAFRALMRDFPDYDTTALWMHAYDVECEVVETNPTNGNGQMPSLPSVGTGVVSPPT
jgi:hypothetical protein